MLQPINNTNFRYKNLYTNNLYAQKTYIPSLHINNYDCVVFTGMSQASEYKTVFDYLSAKILSGSKRFNINSGMLSASKIAKATKEIFKSPEIYKNFSKTDYTKIKWKNYIPLDIRENSVDKINHARTLRLNYWADMLQNPEKLKDKTPELSKKLENNSLKFVIWHAITSELKADNRHIPVPFNEDALLQTIKRFEDIQPIDRNVTCAKPSFIEYYTHRLRDNLLMSMNLSNNSEVWVKIPSFKHDSAGKLKNIENLEILSNKNWCTRSSDDKASDALTDGDFYIYLKRTKPFNMWEPMVGMTSLKGKIDQIQGKENDNIVPVSLVGKIKEFIETSKLSCQSGIIDDGPKAAQAIMISEKLNEKDIETGKTLFTAIKDGEIKSVFKMLGVEVKSLKNGHLKINGYKPSFNIDPIHGHTIPYSMFGIDENELLKSVEIIDGNFILYNKNKVYNSTISKFPPNLKTVTGKIVCSREQFEKYQDDILKVVGGNIEKVMIKG